MILKNKDLNEFYSNAYHAFYKCIRDKENIFFVKELEIPLNSIVFKNESIIVQYLKNNHKNYIITVKIQLFSQDEQLIGSYTSIEDEDATPIDDFLIFL